MRVINRLVVVSGVAAAALLSPSFTPPSASAAACTDVQVVFARGTFEAPGVGGVGQAFVDSLRSKIGDKSMDVYPVNYPASLDFATAADGVIDARNKVQDVANTCPNTEIVLGGFSQGAAVAGYITADAVPPGFTLPQGITGPMPSDVADHVAAVRSSASRRTASCRPSTPPPRPSRSAVCTRVRPSICAPPQTRSVHPVAGTARHTTAIRSTG